MPAKRKVKKTDQADQLSAIATEDLTDNERLAALGANASHINVLMKNADYRAALRKGAAAVDALALQHLFQLVTGDFEVVEDRFPIRDENGNITGTRKIVRPGPSFQACKYWLELRAANEASAQSSGVAAGMGVPSAESKEQVMSSILALIKPKDDPVIEDTVP